MAIGKVSFSDIRLIFIRNGGIVYLHLKSETGETVRGSAGAIDPARKTLLFRLNHSGGRDSKCQAIIPIRGA